jgi:hypothetical protein
VGPAATRGLPTDNQVAVRPGDSSSAAEVEGWLWDYAAGRDPHLRERIILAYLGLADRPAGGTRPLRAGPAGCVVREFKRYLAGYQLGVHVPRPLKKRMLQLCRGVDERAQALGRSPTIMGAC